MTDEAATGDETGSEAAAETSVRNGRVVMPDPKLLELLVCPVTRGPLAFDARRGELVSKGARLAYPIRDGIPIMLPSEARRLEDGPVPSAT